MTELYRLSIDELKLKFEERDGRRDVAKECANRLRVCAEGCNTGLMELGAKVIEELLEDLNNAI